MDEQYSQYEIQYMTRPEAEEFLQSHSIGILPLGATEQHGPHLPLGTDTFLAKEMAIRLAQRLEAAVFPALPVGYSWVWKDIPGTMIVSVENLKGLLQDIIESLDRNSLKKLIIVNAHGANNSTIKYAIRDMADGVETELYYFTYPGLEEASEHAETPKWQDMVHACELETSWLLAARPELCQMEKAVREYPSEDEAYKYHHSTLPMGALSNSGVYGDATKATKEKGEVMLKKLVDYMEKVIRTAGD